MDSKDLKRYQRQLILEGWGEETQQKVAKSTVFIAGAGGLGAPVINYLAAAGVGCIRIADYDSVDLSNLNRQILYNTNDIGKLKAEITKKRIQDLNPNIEVQTFDQKINDSNIANLVGDASIIIDCLDNFEARMCINDHSITSKIPIMHAGIEGWGAQLSFINPPHTPCLKCFIKTENKSNGPIPVLGSVAGIVGAVQATEVIKFLIDHGTLLMNKLLYFDAIRLEWIKIEIARDAQCSACGCING